MSPVPQELSIWLNVNAPSLEGSEPLLSSVFVSLSQHEHSGDYQNRHSTIVGYRSETKPIDFGVNGYNFKVKGHKNLGFDISAHSSSILIDIGFVLF